MIQFKVPGVPVAQPRAKASTRGGHVGMYTPTKTSTGKSNGIAEFKAALKLVAAQHHQGPLMEGPLRVDVCGVFPRQKSKVWAKKPMPRYRKVTKPDSDNIAKAVWDALTGVLWVDDAQVCASFVSKWHASGDESPHVLVTVVQLTEI